LIRKKQNENRATEQETAVMLKNPQSLCLLQCFLITKFWGILWC